jgi:Flp pilus assembly pilin Flp
MKRLLSTLLGNDRGQDLAEYGIALAILAISAAAAAMAISHNVQELWNSAGTLPPAF